MVETSSSLVELVHSSPTLKKRLSYPRFVDDQLRIVVIEGRYHLVEEVRNAFARRGHQIISISLSENSEEMISTVLRALAQAQPDFIFTVNFLGFDQSGALGSILETLQVPVAVWLVDSPLFILRGQPVPAPQMSQVFCWEKAYIDALQSSCACHYLPLATEPSLFQGEPYSQATDVSFVGDSGYNAQQKWQRRLRAKDERIVEELSQAFAKKTGNQIQQALLDPTLVNKLLTDPNTADRWAAATWRANSRHRTNFLRKLGSLPVRLYGDMGWQAMLPGIDVETGPSYGSDLAKVYQRSAVNLNITSLQMPTALNQRVFDVPAAGGLLLTDHQEEVYNLFSEQEIVTWSTPEEALDKARFYQDRPDLRRELITRCQQTIMRSHTYGHRVEELLTVLRKRFGPTRFRPNHADQRVGDDARMS